MTEISRSAQPLADLQAERAVLAAALLDGEGQERIIPRIASVSSRTTVLCGPLRPRPLRVRRWVSGQPMPLLVWVILILRAMTSVLQRAAGAAGVPRISARVRPRTRATCSAERSAFDAPDGPHAKIAHFLNLANSLQTLPTDSEAFRTTLEEVVSLGRAMC